MKNMMKGPVNRSVEALTKHLKALHCSENREKQQRAPSKLSHDILQIHLICYGDVDKKPNPENAAKLVGKLLDSKENLFLKLAQNMENLEFDARKQVSDILNYIIRRSQRNKSFSYIQCKTDRNGYNPIINALFNPYNQNTSSTLHEMCKRPELTKMLLFQIAIPFKQRASKSNKVKKHSVSEAINHELTAICSVSSKDNDEKKKEYEDKIEVNHDFVEELFVLAQNPCFNTSSNAYRSLYHLLIHGNKQYVISYLKDNFERIFVRMNKLIQCDHFVTQKQFLLLLRDLLTNKNNYEIMMKYISKKENLAIMMTLMKKYEKNSLSFEAYQCFKIFVANPDRSREIDIILWKNKDRLLQFLSTFHDDKAREDPTFSNERSVVLEHLTKISIPKELEEKLRRRTH